MKNFNGIVRYYDILHFLIIALELNSISEDSNEDAMCDWMEKVSNQALQKHRFTIKEIGCTSVSFNSIDLDGEELMIDVTLRDDRVVYCLYKGCDRKEETCLKHTIKLSSNTYRTHKNFWTFVRDNESFARIVFKDKGACNRCVYFRRRFSDKLPEQGVCLSVLNEIQERSIENSIIDDSFNHFCGNFEEKRGLK